MLTNLLDKTVKIHLANGEFVGKICAIYGENHHGFSVAVATEDGKIHCLFASQVTLNKELDYYVVLFWTPAMKIRAIKVVRGITGVDLKTAKETVEAQPNGIKVKERLSYEEAQEIKRRIIQDDGMECDVRKVL